MIWIALASAFLTGFIVGRIRRSSGTLYFVKSTSLMELNKPVEEIQKHRTAQFKVVAEKTRSM